MQAKARPENSAFTAPNMSPKVPRGPISRSSVVARSSRKRTCHGAFSVAAPAGPLESFAPVFVPAVTGKREAGNSR